MSEIKTERNISMYIVGVDVAKRSHEATVIDQNGNTIRKPFNFRNDADGFQMLMSALEVISPHPSDFVIGMESTSHYWLALYSNLQRRGYTVHVFNPSNLMRCGKCSSVRLRTTNETASLLQKLFVSDDIRKAVCHRQIYTNYEKCAGRASLWWIWYPI